MGKEELRLMGVNFVMMTKFWRWMVVMVIQQCEHGFNATELCTLKWFNGNYICIYDTYTFLN